LTTPQRRTHEGGYRPPSHGPMVTTASRLACTEEFRVRIPVGPRRPRVSRLYGSEDRPPPSEGGAPGSSPGRGTAAWSPAAPVGAPPSPAHAAPEPPWLNGQSARLRSGRFQVRLLVEVRQRCRVIQLAGCVALDHVMRVRTLPRQLRTGTRRSASPPRTAAAPRYRGRPGSAPGGGSTRPWPNGRGTASRARVVWVRIPPDVPIRGDRLAVVAIVHHAARARRDGHRPLTPD
jgi:hypothetical protein